MAVGFASVSDRLRRHKLYRGDERLDERLFGIFISPASNGRSIKVFDRNADLYYFNCTGSDAPTACGSMPPTAACYEAITPRQLAGRSGVVVTEACYGPNFRITAAAVMMPRRQAT